MEKIFCIAEINEGGLEQEHDGLEQEQKYKIYRYFNMPGEY